jgi:hypothetical protein
MKDFREFGDLANWDAYLGMHHIGSSLLPSGLVHTLDPNSPPVTKVTSLIISLSLDMRIYILLVPSLPFKPSSTCDIYFQLHNHAC